MDEMYIYIAEFKNGRGYLARVGVAKETKKTFRLTGQNKVLVGGHLSYKCYCRIINKAEVKWFRSQEQAYLYLRKKASEYVEQCRKELSFAQGQLDGITHLVNTAEKSRQLIIEANNLVGRLLNCATRDARCDRIIEKACSRLARRIDSHIKKFGRNTLPILLG